MSADDPHAPTPAGPDQEEKTEAHTATDPFALESEVEPTPVVAPSDATADLPAGTAAPAPDPAISTPSAFTPPGTPEGEPSRAVAVTEQAQALTDKPEVQVGLAFLGGAVASTILKRFGR